MQITTRQLAQSIKGLPEPNAFHGEYVSADVAQDNGWSRVTFKKVRHPRANGFGFGYERALDIVEAQTWPA